MEILLTIDSGRLIGMRNRKDLIKDLEETLTESILKDFEKLGWVAMRNTPYVLELVKDNFTIEIDKTNKGYSAHFTEYNNRYFTYFEMEEHILLHELFKCWGWL